MSIGRYLVQERELRGVSIEEVARLTRIPVSTLRAIESGEPGEVPERVYLLGYLRSYAEAVGLDADDVLLRYEELAGPDEADPVDFAEESPKLEQPGGHLTRWIIAALLLASAVGGLIAAARWLSP